MKFIFSTLVIFLSNICFSSEIIDKCYGAYWRTNQECADYLLQICSHTAYWSKYSCVSTINMNEMEDKYEIAKNKLSSMISSEDRCEKYGGLRQAHYFSKNHDYDIDFDLYEMAANDGYLYAMQVLATSEKFYSRSIDGAKKSIYWSLMFNYRLNQKTKMYEEMKKIRKELAEKLSKDQLVKTYELFLANVKKTKFDACSGY